MAGLGRSLSGGDVVGLLSGPALVAWVTSSCLAQGVPVKVTDVRVIERVRALLGGGPGGPERGASTVGSTGARSEVPHRLDPVGVQLRGSEGPRQDDGVVQHTPDDGSLAVEVETRPLTA